MTHSRNLYRLAALVVFVLFIFTSSIVAQTQDNSDRYLMAYVGSPSNNIILAESHDGNNWVTSTTSELTLVGVGSAAGEGHRRLIAWVSNGGALEFIDFRLPFLNNPVPLDLSQLMVNRDSLGPIQPTSAPVVVRGADVGDWIFAFQVQHSDIVLYAYDLDESVYQRIETTFGIPGRDSIPSVPPALIRLGDQIVIAWTRPGSPNAVTYVFGTIDDANRITWMPVRELRIPEISGLWAMNCYRGNYSPTLTHDGSKIYLSVTRATCSGSLRYQIATIYQSTSNHGWSFFLTTPRVPVGAELVRVAGRGDENLLVAFPQVERLRLYRQNSWQDMPDPFAINPAPLPFALLSAPAPCVPDLAINEVLVYPPDPTERDDINVLATIRNDGCSAASRTNMTIRISDEAMSEEYTIPRLESFQRTIQLRESHQYSPQAYALRVVVDPDNRVAEWNEDNNTYDGRITVSECKPDLVISELLVRPRNLTTTDRIYIGAMVTNVGCARSRRTTVNIRIGGESSGTEFPVKALLPGQRDVHFRAHTSFSEGNHWVNAVVDLGNIVNELDETNNLMRRNLRVTR